MCPSAVPACRTWDRVWVQQMKPPDIWWSLSNHCTPQTPLPKLRATWTSGKRELPALCVSLQPVTKQLGWFSNMSVIKHLFYSAHFIPMKRSGHCSVVQVKARVLFPFLPHPNCCHRALPLLLLLPLLNILSPQTQPALPSQPRQKSQEETQDKGWHIVTMSQGQSRADFSPFPMNCRTRPWCRVYLECIQDSAIVVDHHGVSLLPFQPRGTLQPGMDLI